MLLSGAGYYAVIFCNVYLSSHGTHAEATTYCPSKVLPKRFSRRRRRANPYSCFSLTAPSSSCDVGRLTLPHILSVADPCPRHCAATPSGSLHPQRGAVAPSTAIPITSNARKSVSNKGEGCGAGGTGGTGGGYCPSRPFHILCAILRCRLVSLIPRPHRRRWARPLRSTWPRLPAQPLRRVVGSLWPFLGMYDRI